jgi:hypothetical protein
MIPIMLPIKNTHMVINESMVLPQRMRMDKEVENSFPFIYVLRM